MTKILWHSNAGWANTGYGVQTGLFVPRLKALGHDIAVSAVWGLEGSSMTMDGIHHYPSDGSFGNRTLASWASHHAGPGNDLRDCLVITLVDVWPLKLDALKLLNLASWVPVDSEPAPEGVIDYFKRTGAKPIAMSKFGKAELEAAGFDPLYVPHGVDTSIYKPLPAADRAAMREALDLPESAFLVGMVANNQGNSPPRKAFSETLAAFGKFRKSHPDAFLYLHTQMVGFKDGVDIETLMRLHDVPAHSVRYASQFLLEYGIPAEGMAQIYNAMDVLVNASMGEGFGVPIIEAQCCGVPVIVGGWTAMPELCGAGWTVEGQKFYIEGGRMGVSQRSFQYVPFIDSIADRMGLAYLNAEGLREKAAEFGKQYDADLVTDTYWKPALATLEKRREQERVLPKVQLNRRQRRLEARKAA